LAFDIHLTFELWHLKLKIRYFLLAAPFWGTNEGNVFAAWIFTQALSGRISSLIGFFEKGGKRGNKRG
jgi:hypothetical protein